MKRIYDRFNVYTHPWMILIYALCCSAKIFFQINFNYFFQCLILISLNYLLIFPFLKEHLYVLKSKVLLYFVILSLGEFIIIFHKNDMFLKLGILFYLLSKFVLLLLLKNSLKDFRIVSLWDSIKIIGPQLVSFAVGFLIYNNSDIDIPLSILIIIYAVLSALIFSYIFYFKNFVGMKIIVIGLILISIHESFGGFNFFNQNIDKDFVISFSLISVGKYFLGLGFWQSRIASEF